MRTNRRDFLKTSLAAGLAGALPHDLHAESTIEPKPVTVEQLNAAAARPVLNLKGLSTPVKIASIELFRFETADDDYYLVRARSSDGAEGFSFPNSRAAYLHPIFNRLVAPYLIGKDARELEALIHGVYRHRSNYKLQGLALWCPVAWVEFALLDMLGRILRKPVGELFGGVIRRRIPAYAASGSRDTTPKQEVEKLAGLVAETGCHAVKFKVGGRMSNNADSIPGRTEALIPLVRKVLGPDITIQADANSSYDPPKAIQIGRMLEEIDAYMFEEPCPFDHLEDTKRVADALTINVAGGEQESSQRRFRWMIANNAVQIVQPDLHYYGGFIRSMRVARMAAAADIHITLHISGGLGYSQMIHFASCAPNMGRFQEYEGGVRETGSWFDPPIVFKDGALTVPTAPGFGITAAPDLLKNARKII
ncbi:MAG: enolase C-terminal domain-like protein [Planctomycetota bacterium]|jgi:L-alanine-DL-glutamate epimerase-like enolase superfamily enzyme